jgi:hypothetical protein
MPRQQKTVQKIDQVMAALIEAEAHVTRQQFAGKHQQDRLDAEDWLNKWAGLVKWARLQPRQPPIRWDAPLGAPGDS